MNLKSKRKERIKYKMKKHQNVIKTYYKLIDECKRELDFIKGNVYDNTWEEEYPQFAGKD